MASSARHAADPLEGRDLLLARARASSSRVLSSSRSRAIELAVALLEHVGALVELLVALEQPPLEVARARRAWRGPLPRPRAGGGPARPWPGGSAPSAGSRASTIRAAFSWAALIDCSRRCRGRGSRVAAPPARATRTTATATRSMFSSRPAWRPAPPGDAGERAGGDAGDRVRVAGGLCARGVAGEAAATSRLGSGPCADAECRCRVSAACRPGSTSVERCDEIAVPEFGSGSDDRRIWARSSVAPISARSVRPCSKQGQTCGVGRPAAPRGRRRQGASLRRFLPGSAERVNVGGSRAAQRQARGRITCPRSTPSAIRGPKRPRPASLSSPAAFAIHSFRKSAAEAYPPATRAATSGSKPFRASSAYAHWRRARSSAQSLEGPRALREQAPRRVLVGRRIDLAARRTRPRVAPRAQPRRPPALDALPAAARS